MDRTEQRKRAQARLGTTVGDGWVLHGLLGIGGTSAVYAAAHQGSNAKAAIKVLHRWVFEAVPLVGERMMREARAASSIGHPAIAQVLDSGEHQGSPYIVFEWLDGKNLEDALRDGGLAASRVLTAFEEVLGALWKAHDVGIVHRDVKPANVFLLDDGPGTAKLLDFGAARHEAEGIESITAEGSLIGTIPYMSPEQARGQRVGPLSDIFSTGAALFRAFAGRPPFSGTTALEVLHQIANEPAPRLASVRPGVPDEVAAVVDRALAHEPSARWQSAIEMSEAVAAISHRRVDTAVLPQAQVFEPDLREDAESATERAPVPALAEFEGTQATKIVGDDEDDQPTIDPDAPDETAFRSRVPVLIAIAVAVVAVGAALLSFRPADIVEVQAEPVAARTPAAPPPRPIPVTTVETTTRTATVAAPEPPPPSPVVTEPPPEPPKPRLRRRRRVRRPKKRAPPPPPPPKEPKIDDVLLEEI